MCLLSKNMNYLDQCAISLIRRSSNRVVLDISAMKPLSVSPNLYFLHLRYPDIKKHLKTFVTLTDSNDFDTQKLSLGFHKENEIDIHISLAP